MHHHYRSHGPVPTDHRFAPFLFGAPFLGGALGGVLGGFLGGAIARPRPYPVMPPYPPYPYGYGGFGGYGGYGGYYPYR